MLIPHPRLPHSFCGDSDHLKYLIVLFTCQSLNWSGKKKNRDIRTFFHLTFRGHWIASKMPRVQQGDESSWIFHVLPNVRHSHRWLSVLIFAVKENATINSSAPQTSRSNMSRHVEATSLWKSKALQVPARNCNCTHRWTDTLCVLLLQIWKFWAYFKKV